MEAWACITPPGKIWHSQPKLDRLNMKLYPMRGFKTLLSAKATLQGIETIRTIKNNHIHQHKSGTLSEIEHLHKLFGLAA